jgi:hypothetical protein
MVVCGNELGVEHMARSARALASVLQQEAQNCDLARRETVSGPTPKCSWPTAPASQSAIWLSMRCRYRSVDWADTLTPLPIWRLG